MDKEEKKQKTVKISIFISIILSISIIILILFFTVDAKTIEQLKVTKINYLYFGIAVLLNILYWVFWGARMMVLANAMDKNVKIGLWESTKIVIANLFLAGITPSMAGGEPVRIYLLKKDGMSFGGATAAVLGERLIDAIFILIMVPIALFIFKDVRNLGFISKGIIIGVIVFIVAIAVFIYALVRPNKVKAFLIYVSKKFSRFSRKKESENKIVNRINNIVDDFHNSMYSFSGKNKRPLVLASALTVLFWSMGFLLPSFVLMGLGLPPFFLESFAIQILLIIILMMPLTPGGAGVAEISIYGFYGVLIGTSTDSLIGVFVVLYRFITFHMSVIAGAIFQYRIFKSITSFSLDAIKKHEE